MLYAVYRCRHGRHASLTLDICCNLVKFSNWYICLARDGKYIYAFPTDGLERMIDTGFNAFVSILAKQKYIVQMYTVNAVNAPITDIVHYLKIASSGETISNTETSYIALHDEIHIMCKWQDMLSSKEQIQVGRSILNNSYNMNLENQYIEPINYQVITLIHKNLLNPISDAHGLHIESIRIFHDEHDEIIIKGSHVVVIIIDFIDGISVALHINIVELEKCKQTGVWTNWILESNRVIQQLHDCMHDFMMR